MSEAELYEALRVLVREYMMKSEQEELLDLLNSKETQGMPAPGKGILQSLSEHKNGRTLRNMKGFTLKSATTVYSQNLTSGSSRSLRSLGRA